MPVEGAAAAGIESEEMEQSPATPSSSTSRTKHDQVKRAGVQTPLAAPPRGKGGPENTHHRYRGVRQTKSGKWSSEISERNRGRRHLGTFSTAVDAAIAYDRAAIAILGSRAIINFGSTVIHCTSRMKHDQAKRPGVQTPLAAPPRRKSDLENMHHRYRGVRQTRSGKWSSEISEPNRGRRHLGTFNTAVDAAIAYDRAAIANLGFRATVNFGSTVVHCTSRTKQAQAKSSATPAVQAPVVAPRGKASPENRRHGYRGIWQRKSGRWASEIREHGKRHWVGTFGTAVDAAIAYDRAAIAIIGSHAVVNFPSALPVIADAPVQCCPTSCFPSAPAATVFSEHELKLMVTVPVLGEHGVNLKVDATSIFDEHEVKPMLTASVFNDDDHEVKPMVTTSVFSKGEVKPMVDASVLGEHEVEPMPALGGSGVTDISQHLDVSWDRQGEVFADCLNDIAMYIGLDPFTEKLAFHTDVKSEDYLVDGLDAEFANSPLWSLGD